MRHYGLKVTTLIMISMILSSCFNKHEDDPAIATEKYIDYTKDAPNFFYQNNKQFEFYVDIKFLSRSDAKSNINFVADFNNGVSLVNKFADLNNDGIIMIKFNSFYADVIHFSVYIDKDNDGNYLNDVSYDWTGLGSPPIWPTPGNQSRINADLRGAINKENITIEIPMQNTLGASG
jgi:hypothetical protein